jgi:hypothetical protein
MATMATAPAKKFRLDRLLLAVVVLAGVGAGAYLLLNP